MPSFKPAVAVVALALALGSAPAVAVQKLTLSSTTAVHGQNAAISLGYLGDGSVVGLQLDVTFDPAVLGAPSVTAGTGLGPQVLRSALIAAGRLRLVVYSALNMAVGDGELARVSFAVSNTAPFGNSPLALSGVVLGTASATAVAPTELVDGAVTVLADTDLAISKSDGVTMATPGGSLTYAVNVSNLGPNPAPGATVTDALPTSLTCTWTCVGGAGGVCPASGSGSIHQTVDLPSGGSVAFTVSCTVSPSATNVIANTASVTTPGGVVDLVPGNDSAVDIDILPTIFRDAFESGDTSHWSQQEPAGLVVIATRTTDGERKIAFGYDFATLEAEDSLAPSPIAVVVDGAGGAIYAIEARREDALAPLELRLVAVDADGGAHANAWQPVAMRSQDLLLEWDRSPSGDGTLALSLDGRLALWLEGFSSPRTPPVGFWLRGPDPRRATGDR